MGGIDQIETPNFQKAPDVIVELDDKENKVILTEDEEKEQDDEASKEVENEDLDLQNSVEHFKSFVPTINYKYNYNSDVIKNVPTDEKTNKRKIKTPDEIRKEEKKENKVAAIILSILLGCGVFMAILLLSDSLGVFG